MAESFRTTDPGNCGHLRVYHSNFGRWDERQGMCLFCEAERLRTALKDIQNKAKDLNDAIGIANNALCSEPS